MSKARPTTIKCHLCRRKVERSAFAGHLPKCLEAAEQQTSAEVCARVGKCIDMCIGMCIVMCTACVQTGADALEPADTASECSSSRSERIQEDMEAVREEIRQNPWAERGSFFFRHGHLRSAPTANTEEPRRSARP